MKRFLPMKKMATHAVLAMAGSALGDSRSERPLQVQAVLFGASVGYHFNDLIYVGFTQQESVEMRHMDCLFCGYGADERVYGQNRVDDAHFDFALRRSLEVRFSPWEGGFYFALGLLSVGSDMQRIVYGEAPRVIGNHAYDGTGLRLELKTKPYRGLAGGMGFNHVFDSGLSLGVGFLSGLTPEKTPEVTVTTFGAHPASPADLEIFKDKVEDEYLGFPSIGMIHLAIGYNF